VQSESIVDEKGRICIPAELRKRLNIKAGEKVLFQTDNNDTIIIRLKNEIIKALNTYNPFLTDCLSHKLQ